MELKEVLLKRRSVRKFTKEEVSKEDIDYLMHAAMSGPSAVNMKPWEFYVVTKEAKLEELHEASKFTKMDAPLAIIVCGNKTKSLPLGLGEFWVQDCSAATENILLAATDLGLGAVWCGIYPNKKAVKRVSFILDLKKTHVPLNIIYVGHPAEQPEARDQYSKKNIHTI